MIKNFHNRAVYQKQINLPIINKLILTYQDWQNFLIHFPKTSRYSLGAKIDSLFIEIIELTHKAITLNRQNKLPYLIRANLKLDLLKFFLQIAWQIKAIDNKRYIFLSTDLEEIGKMFGGWIRQLKKETSA